ncbi:MAG: glycosyltransferase family 9 protein [Kiloniellales bacterium]
MPERILVIKLGALGDFIHALGPMAAIRRHNPVARITLLTTPAYRELAEKSGYFDEVWLDERAPLLRLDRWLPLVRRMRRARFARVYDLQWADRTAWYFHLLLWPKPEWAGIVRGCSHRMTEPKKRVHIRERHAELLRLAGISEVPPPDLSFLDADISRYGIEGPYALLVPGSSPRHPEKRWPVARFVVVAQALAARGIAPVLICGPAEREEAAAIARACPAAHDIDSNREEIVALARGASVAVSNDTGPSFLIAAAGCPLVVLYNEKSDPVKLAPPGERVTVLQRRRMEDIKVAEVLAAVDALLEGPGETARAR